MMDGESLGDHPPHGDPDDVGALDPQRAEQRGRIVGHVLHHVRHRTGVPAQQRDEVRHTFELRRKTRVTVVEANGEEAVSREPFDERLGPGDQLLTQPHDEEQCGGARIPARHVLDIDPVDVCGRHDLLPWVDGAQQDARADRRAEGGAY